MPNLDQTVARRRALLAWVLPAGVGSLMLAAGALYVTMLVRHLFGG